MDSIYAISVMPLKSPKKLSILKPIGLFALFWVILAATAVAQISGPTTSPAGVATIYTFDNGINYAFSNWAITNGTVNSSSSSGTTYTANVTWTAPGSGSIQFRNKTSVIATLNVTVCSGPAAPSVTFSYSSGCPAHNGEGAIISYSGTPPGGETWYWQSPTDGPTGTNTTLGSGNALTTTNNTFGTFYLRPFNSCGWGNALATVDIPNRVYSTTASPINVCVGSQVSLDAVAFGPATIRWYDACQGGNMIYSTTSSASSFTSTYLTPPITASTSYYVTVFNGVAESQRRSISISTLTTPGTMTPSANPAIFCGSGGITTLTATGAGANDFYQWYTVPTGGTAIPDANPLTQTVNATTTFYVAGKNINTQCEGPRTAVTVTVNTVPTAPNVTTQRQCTQAGVYATATPGANADDIKWYDAGGGLIGTGANSPIAASAVTYYASSYNSVTGCESATRTAFTIEVLNPPTASPATICGGATIPATPGLGATKVRWYAVPTGGTALAAGLNSPATATTTTYYITSYNNVSGCESPLPRVPVTVTVVPLPTITGNAPINFTYGSATSINITLSTSPYYSYQWKKDGAAVGNNQTLPTDLIGSYTVSTKTSASSIECTSLPTNVTNTLTGQPTPINYVSNTRIMKEGVTSSTSLYSLNQKDLVQTLAYQDGLGRTFQTVGLGQSATQTDLVSPVAYGKQGMVDSTFLPYATATRDGRLRLNAIRGGANFQYSLSEQKAFYQNTPLVATDANPYARSVHRVALDARVTEQGAPGADWQPGTTHTARNSVVLNDAATYAVRYWKPDGSTTGNYPSNTVTVAIITDENGNQVRTYTNQQGQTVLKQVQLDETISGSTVNWLNTYYIYDEFGRLKFQVPPKATALITAASFNVATSTVTNKLVYSYVYDSMSRVVEKTEPGAAVKYIVYDKLGRVALTQDGNLRASKQWIYTKYDQYNRPVYSGVYTNTTKVSRKAVQGLLIDDTLPYFESPANNATYRGYSNTAFPTANVPSGAITVLAASYYDGYDFDQNGTADFTYQPSHIVADANSNTVLPSTPNANVRNLPTGSGKLVLGTTIWVTNAAFYDQYDRTLQTHGFNHLNSTTPSVGSVVYADRAGHVEKTKQTHNGPSGSTVAVQQRYGYDDNWRTKVIYHSINGAAEVQVANYSYNILGQVVDKKLHVVAGTPLQSVDLRYTIRGWVKSINNAQLTNDSGTTNDDTNDYFGMELHYNTVEAGLGNTKYYNGNVSAAKWKGPGFASGATDQRSYKYTYDKSDKLKAATFAAHDGSTWAKEANTLNESMTYEHNGNILTLARNQNNRGLTGATVTSAPQTVDQLTYSYTTNSNQMLKVEDAVATTIGAGDFKNGTNVATEYTYTADGSMNKDLNKGISTITYNILNKPQVVTYSGTPTKTVTYTYDASGTKIKAVTLVNSVTTTTDYIGGFVYTNNVLSFFSSPEGRVVKNGANYEYQYAIADHQGNTRVLFTSAAPSAQPVTADFEAATNASFQNYVNRSTFSLFNRTAGGTTSQLLNGGVNGQVGLAKTYRIYAGDKVKIEAYGKYTNATSTASNLSGFASALLAAYSLPAPAGGETGTPSAALNTWGGLVAGGSGGTGTVKAFVNIIVFDKNYRLLDMMWDPIDANANQVGTTPVVAHDYMMREYTAKEESIVYMYVSNESPTLVDVYFDDVTMTYTPGNILQYNEYYPFGLSTANSWTRENTTGNNFLYNGGTELNTTTGVYDLHYRNYDPVLGRMNQVDPVASKYSSVTPYNYSLNSPINFNDPLGDDVYVSTALYNFVMSFFNRSGGARSAGGSGAPIMDSGNAGGGFVGGGGSGGGGGSSGGWDPNGYNGSGTWTRGGGWVYETNGQSLQRGIDYNNQFNSWGNTILGSVPDTQYGAGVFMFEYNGNNYGGNYHTENGKVMSVGVHAVTQSANGAWKGNGDFSISILGEAQQADKGNTANLFGALSRFLGSFDFAMSSTDLTVGRWVTDRASNILNGTGKLHPSFMNLADKNFMYANRFMSGTRTLQVLKIAKVAGPVATVAGIGISTYNIASGNGTGLDYADIGVNAVGLGTSVLVTVGLVSNPVGWVIGAGVLIYNGVRLYQSFAGD